jgi:predicted nucleic acid-binding protein
MTIYLLDTSALLTLRDDEAGADDVAAQLDAGRQSGAPCRVCFISLMEVLDRVWQDEGRLLGRLAYEQCLSLPLIVVHEDTALLEKAAEIKAVHRLSVADAWIAAAAILCPAVLVHKDPEFDQLDIPQHRLPFK